MTMTRRKITSPDGNKIYHSSDGQIRRSSGPSIKDLPREILVDILLKLPATSILSCNCVCKRWRLLISDPQFVELHFGQEKTSLLIRQHGCCFYLMEQLQPADEFRSRKLKLYSKRMIPPCNTQVTFHPGLVYDTPDVSIRRGKDIIECLKREYYSHYKIVNSCNGLVLMAGSLNEPLAVFNPVMGEFTTLPGPWLNQLCEDIHTCGLGFSPKHGQYKVIYTCYRKSGINPGSCCEILTLGSSSPWKCLGRAPYEEQDDMNLPTYLNGALHWLTSANNSILYFDFDNERFHFLSVPEESSPMLKTSIGVLKGFLCICNFPTNEALHIWIMEEYGVCKTWSKYFSFSFSSPGGYDLRYYRPLSFSSNGTLLMFDPRFNSLLAYDFGLDNFKKYDLPHTSDLEFDNLPYSYFFEAITYIPSSISLKDIATRRV